MRRVQGPIASECCWLLSPCTSAEPFPPTTQDFFHFFQAFRVSLIPAARACLLLLPMHMWKNAAGGSLCLQFGYLATPQPNHRLTSGCDLGEKLPLNLLCTCRGSDSLCFLSCCGQNCPVIKNKPPGNIHKLWYLKIWNKSTVQVQLILPQGRWWARWFPETPVNSFFYGLLVS